jgi:hypothetical protein
MQEFLDIWLAVNSLIAIIWGFTLLVFIAKCTGGRNRKLAEVQKKIELEAEELTRPDSKKSAPRKWREIEAIKDNLALNKLVNEDYSLDLS